ncbi:MAG: BMP family ABC transporter substrate-binding protein, partial [Candidatus Promineifilaceae bacterium]
MSKLFPQESGKLLRLILAAGLSAVLLLGLTMCTQSAGAPVAEEPAQEEQMAEEPAQEGEMAEEEMAEEVAPAGEAEAADSAVLAIEHFSVIEGTTWSGAHHRAGQRIAEKYPNVQYVFREEVGPDLAVPYAEEMIASDGATIVIGNAEFMGLPLADIADQYPDVYFGSAITSDLTTERNFIRFFPRQYQALYLEGLIAGALTETGNIGIVS